MNKIYERPKVGDVKRWATHFESDIVKIQSAREPWCDLYKVSVTGQRPKYYFGEMAWAEARSHAASHDFGAWDVFH